MLDLGQGKTESPGLRHKPEKLQCVVPIESIAGFGAAWHRQDPRRLVAPQRFPTDAAPGRDVPDEQAVPSHGQSVNPTPRGKVKRRALPGPERHGLEDGISLQVTGAVLCPHVHNC